MSITKHYPDINTMRIKTAQVDRAIMSLLKMGVEIMAIDFRLPQPLIEVYDCPSNRKITDVEAQGRGCNEKGHYVRKRALVKGCKVEWSELR
jgi:hypothetical protein